MFASRSLCERRFEGRNRRALGESIGVKDLRNGLTIFVANLMLAVRNHGFPLTTSTDEFPVVFRDPWPEDGIFVGDPASTAT